MKITKTVKYNYRLTGGTLEKDIESFIEEVKDGKYDMDRHYKEYGLKMIKQYFRLLGTKFDNQEYEECKNCYGKLIIFLFDSSQGEIDADFGYEDLLAKASNDFDKLVGNYFVCLVKTCEIEELSDRVFEYASHLGGYGFDSDMRVLLSELDGNNLEIFWRRMLIKIEGMTKETQDKTDVVYFLMGIAEEQGDKEKYFGLCERLKSVVSEEEYECLKKEYGEDG